ncbi:sulfatase [uncultured Dysosmobacter sp.]|uniref:sulfatase family protein n=1 Tax=uncultured Dysosmobacter sp. TaxID=2591384 RepID=UPI002632AB87|nr:sulfatase-like hydrolase/transferase [uncultured Dysosmobacter sp.]
MKYNLLFLMADQFAYDAFGYMSSFMQTPNLDRLASGAICFSNCYTNSPLCMPARASLATGLYPEELKTMDNYAAGLTPASQTWMQRIRDAGYETAVFGKVHLHKFSPDLRDLAWQVQSYGYQIVDELPGPRTYATKRSSYYDYLKERGLLECYREDMHRRYQEGHVYDSHPTPLPTKDYADVYIADRALEYLEKVPCDKPWFSTVSFGGPHDPWDTPAEYVERYRDLKPPAPLEAPHTVAAERPRGVYDELLNGKYDPGLTEDLHNMTDTDIQALRRSYYGHVTLIDEQIGRIFDCLERRNMLDNTIIVFTADHGEENGDYGLLFKQTFFETSVRVPMLISLPGKTAQAVDTPVELMDLGPTLCELLGTPVEYGHARSLIPLMKGSNSAKRYIVSQIFGETMLLSRGYKAVFNQREEIYLLFDMLHDPQETENLAGSESTADMEKMLQEDLRAWRLELNANGGDCLASKTC